MLIQQVNSFKELKMLTSESSYKVDKAFIKKIDNIVNKKTKDIVYIKNKELYLNTKYQDLAKHHHWLFDKCFAVLANNNKKDALYLKVIFSHIYFTSYIHNKTLVFQQPEVQTNLIMYMFGKDKTSLTTETKKEQGCKHVNIFELKLKDLVNFGPTKYNNFLIMGYHSMLGDRFDFDAFELLPNQLSNVKDILAIPHYIFETYLYSFLHNTIPDNYLTQYDNSELPIRFAKNIIIPNADKIYLNEENYVSNSQLRERWINLTSEELNDAMFRRKMIYHKIYTNEQKRLAVEDSKLRCDKMIPLAKLNELVKSKIYDKCLLCYATCNVSQVNYCFKCNTEIRLCNYCKYNVANFKYDDFHVCRVKKRKSSSSSS